MRRLLLVTPDAPPASGGIQRFLDGWLRWFPDAQWDVVTTTPGPDEHAGHAVRRVRQPSLPGRAGWVAQRVTINTAGLAAARRVRPDAVVIGVQAAAPAGLLAQRLLGIPAVFIGYGRELGADDAWTRRATRGAALSVVISRASADVLRAAGAPEGRLLLAPPGIEPFDADPPPPPPGPPTIATVSRLDAAHKGLEDVAAAVRAARAEVPELRWALIGTGEPYPAARAAIDTALAEGWGSLHRAVPDAKRDALLDSALAFALASRAEASGRVGEGFGIVFLEAAARGVPSVAPDIDGMRDAITDGRSGLLTAPGDIDAMAAAFVRLARDEALRAQLRADAIEHARAFAWPRVLAPVAAALDRAIAGDPAPAQTTSR